MSFDADAELKKIIRRMISGDFREKDLMEIFLSLRIAFMEESGWSRLDILSLTVTSVIKVQ